jgi:6-pyruvoyltetrahydropterin/6-carboxytetrahydropterin synthase
MEICKEFTFEASHVLPHHKGKCSNLHGHSWKLTVYVRGPVDRETGMVVDYADIKSSIQPIIDDLDHAHLGAWKTDKVEIASPLHTKSVTWLYPMLDTFNPTSENLLIEIAKQIVKRGQVFSSLTLDETCTVSCLLTWEEFQDVLSGETFRKAGIPI